jgi:hypothetical protein
MMTQVEVLETSLEFPLELNAGVGRHEGVPLEVLKHCPPIKPWFLVAWNDEVSRTIGLAHKSHVLVLQRGEVLGLALNFMRPAKGPGLVDLGVTLRSQNNMLSLLRTSLFRQDAVDWVITKKSKIESIFGTQISVFDRGADY